MSKLPICEAADFINGRAFKPSEWSTKGLPIVRIQNLTGTSEAFNFFNGPVSPTNVVKRGDILISWSASLGVYRWTGNDAALNQHIFKVALKPGVDSGYFYFVAMHALNQMIAQVHGSTMQHITKERFDSIPIYLPSEPEQKWVAAILEKADRLRCMRRYAIQLTDTFLQSVFVDRFGDLEVNERNFDVYAFEDIVDSTQLGLVRGSVEMGDSLPFAYVRMDAIVGNGELDLVEVKRVNATSEEAKTFSLQRGDFLFNTRNSRELVGKTALFSRRGTYLFNNNILRVRFKPTVDPRYVIQLFQTRAMKQNLERIKSGTTTVFAIYYKDLRESSVIVPPLPLQQEFVRIVRRFERLRAQQREAERQAEHLFQTLLHRAFAPVQ